jgi:bacteriorhodopsin
MPELTQGEYLIVYNMLSLAVAAMLGSFVFFLTARGQLSPKYRPAMIMSSLVVAIAGYHYLRIFNSWEAAYALSSAGTYVATGQPFNDAYRYVDWLLTVPLLVAELVAVLALQRSVRTPLMAKLVVAAVLMVGLGYPGEIATTNGPRVAWAVASTIPFVYILYVLWVELDKAARNNSPQVQVLLRNTRLLLIGTWGFYPIAYLMPMIGVAGSTAEVGLQIGYSIADIAAKCGYGVMIYHIARAKMEAEGAELAVAPAAVTVGAKGAA